MKNSLTNPGIGEDSHIIRDSNQKIACHGASRIVPFMSWFLAPHPSNVGRLP
ncbi:hypothetical protein [Pseudoduganella plicata]|uniref:hypothetical protein n=1 Tax=Pseudoduganella plicata TaxID=321984 RepID=UPI00141B6D03|nr:hypothetical protein [Pseudoduganella plicata]